MSRIPTLHATRITLSPFTLADAPLVQLYAGDARIAAATAFVPHPYPDGAAEKWIAAHHAQFLEKTNVTLAIRSPGGNLLGAINLKLTLCEKLGEISYWIAVPFWNKGVCTEAARLVIRHGFEAWDLEKMRAHHFAKNRASGRVLEKAGMKRAGIIPRSLMKNGELIDTVQYCVARQDFFATCARTTQP